MHLINRIKQVKKIDKIIVATTINKEDDLIVQFCKSNKVDFFRGSENDVMDRVRRAASYYNVDTIVGVTGDCPLLDDRLISMCLNTFLKSKVDYLSNANLRSYPDGMDVQVYSNKV